MSPRPAKLPVPDSARGGDSTARILAVAESLFAEHGFEAVSMNTIAEAANVCKANVFHHFTSKRELYLAVLHNACRASAAQRLEHLESHRGNFPERFTAYASDLLQGM